MIEVRQLNKSFGKIKAVDGMSFTVKNGERFVILGTSGCGKTTMINRFSEPDSGDVFLNGVSTGSVRPEILRRGIGYVLQDTGLFPPIAEHRLTIVDGAMKPSGRFNV